MTETWAAVSREPRALGRGPSTEGLRGCPDLGTVLCGGAAPADRGRKAGWEGAAARQVHLHLNYLERTWTRRGTLASAR